MSVQDADLAARSRRTGTGRSGTSSRHRRGRPARRSRRPLLIAGVVAVLLLLGVWALLDLRAAYGDLRRAEAAAGQAQSRLLDGDLDAAAESFTRASTAFADAEGALRRPMPRVLGLVPVAGRNLEVVDALAAAHCRARAGAPGR